MPSRLWDAPGIFQGTMEVIPSLAMAILLSIVRGHLLIFRNCSRPYRTCFHSTIAAVQSSGRLNLKKCKFATEKMECLGHVILLGGLKFASHTTDTIFDLKPPRTEKQLKSLLGLYSVQGVDKQLPKFESYNSKNFYTFWMVKDAS